jgi:hypothetical protein
MGLDYLIITDPSSENYRRNSDFWVGFMLMRLSVFALQLRRWEMLIFSRPQIPDWQRVFVS